MLYHFDQLVRMNELIKMVQYWDVNLKILLLLISTKDLSVPYPELVLSLCK